MSYVIYWDQNIDDNIINATGLFKTTEIVDNTFIIDRTVVGNVDMII